MANTFLTACCDTVLNVSAHKNPDQGSLFNRAKTWLRRAYRVARQRRQLRALTDPQLSDLGLSRGAAQNEAARPFWDFS